MKYLGYSELTKRIYILPSSKRQPKIDITEDVQELMDFLSQPASKGMVGEEELMEMLNDKRIISVCGVDEGIWHISRKETARYLLEKYNITKADPTPVNDDAVEVSKGMVDYQKTIEGDYMFNSADWKITRAGGTIYVHKGDTPVNAEPTPSIGVKEFLAYQEKDSLFFIDDVRAWFKKVENKEISYSKLAELLNEKVFVKYHAQFHPKPPTESDAVEFAEWIRKNGYDLCENDKWVEIYDITDRNIEYSTADLYTLFKQHKQG